MEQKRITKIDALPKLQKKTRVAAYARVSSGKDAMLHSLSAQISYYNKFISEHEGWEYAGVYADEALSGTKDTREEFQRLISDCKAGKIDLVICKSISRFARNTMTMLESVRELKTMGIDVFFEEQNLHTLSAEGEMVLTFLSSFAQEEARSMSENMKWRIKKDFENGLIWGAKQQYGYRVEGRKLVVIPDEAEFVRRVFSMYLSGLGFQAIANTFNKEGLKTKNGCRWQKSSVQNIIGNYNYTGDLILQKTFREDYLTKKTRINKGEKNKYYVEDDHEPIVSKETYMAALELRTQRAIEMDRTGKIYPRHAFAFKIKCGLCGASYHHKTTKYTKKWMCRTYDQMGKEACGSKAVPADELDRITREVIGCDCTEENIDKYISIVEVYPDNRLVYHLRNGEVICRNWKDLDRKTCWTPEMKEKARQQALMHHHKEEDGNGES